MKRFLPFMAGAALAAVAMVGIVKPAAAQMQFNCAMLANSPYMCVKNEGGIPIVAIQAIPSGGGWASPSSWITIPGSINPGGAAVVKFPSYKGCMQTVIVRTAEGRERYYWNIDVCHNTSLPIRW